jgi:hypothetical protein
VGEVSKSEIIFYFLLWFRRCRELEDACSDPQRFYQAQVRGVHFQFIVRQQLDASIEIVFKKTDATGRAIQLRFMVSVDNCENPCSVDAN